MNDAIAFLTGSSASVEELEDVELFFDCHAFARVGECYADVALLSGNKDIGSVVATEPLPMAHCHSAQLLRAETGN